MLFANDIMLVEESRIDVDGNIELWRKILESKGFRLSRTKTEYMKYDFSGARAHDRDVSLDGQVVPRRKLFDI